MKNTNKVLNSLLPTLSLISLTLVLESSWINPGAKCSPDKSCSSETTISTNITLPPFKINKKKEDDDENQNEGGNKSNRS